MNPAPAALGLLLGLVAAAGARAESGFLENLHKAESRAEPEDRVEFYGRAIVAWKASDSKALLADCRFRRGEALAERYEFAKAEADLSAALKLDAANARARLLRGKVRLHLNRPGQAAGDFKAYTAAEREDVEGWLALGEAERKAGQAREAEKAYARAQALAPEDFRPALGRARLLAAQTLWSKALALLNEADKLAEGRSPEVLTQRGDCLFVLGWSSPERGLKDYGKAIALYEARLLDLQRSRAAPARFSEGQAETSLPYFGRGRLYEFLQKIPEAVSDYTQACRLGHKQACARAKALSERLPPAPAPKKAPEPEFKPVKPKWHWFKFKRKIERGEEEGDPGLRIYSN